MFGYKIIILSWVMVLGFWGIVLAGDIENGIDGQDSELVCVDSGGAKNILVKVKIVDLLEENLKIANDIIANKEEVIENKDIELGLLNERVVRCEEVNKDLKKVIEQEKVLIKKQDSLVRHAVEIIGGFLVGALVALLL